MKKFLTATLAAALISFSAGNAHASADSFSFDKAHTQIFFSVSHLGFSFSQGAFTDFDGQFAFNPDKPEQGSVDVTIKAASIDLNDQAWNDHMKNEDFLNVEKFPDIRFKSTKVEKTGDNTGRITGDLTILGVTKPVTLETVFNKAGIHPYSKKFVAGFSATTSLNRSDFGMTYGLPGVGDEVNISIEVEGIRNEPAPAPAKK